MRLSNTKEKGIYFRKSTERYEAAVALKRKRSGTMFTVHVGSFDTLNEAVDARREFLDAMK